jgi:hypothetical protein
MGYYDPCRSKTIIDLISFSLLLLLFFTLNNKVKNLYIIYTMPVIGLIIYSFYRIQLHTQFEVSTDVNLFGRRRPKYCE